MADTDLSLLNENAPDGALISVSALDDAIRETRRYVRGWAGIEHNLDGTHKFALSGLLAATGTRLVFDMNAPPVGWTRDVAINDRVINIVSGARLHGGSWVISGLTGPSHAHVMGIHTHTMGGHVHSGPSHTHPITDLPLKNNGTGASKAVSEIVARLNGATGQLVIQGAGAPNDITGVDSASSGVTDAAGTGNTGGPSTNTTDGPSASSTDAAGTGAVVSSGAWRPLARDMIVGVKD